MNVIVQAKTLEVTNALRNFIAKQAQKLGKLGVKISNVWVFMENVPHKNSDPSRAVVRYKVAVPGRDIVVKKSATDLYEAVVAATDSVVRQVRKLKEKRLSIHRQRGHAHEQELEFGI